MLHKFWKAWQSNGGNLLLILGGAAGLVMCLAWYFQWVPDVRMVGRSVSGALVSKSQRSEPSPLVVVLRFPVIHTDPATEMSTSDVSAIVELHLASGGLQPDLSPLQQRAIPLPRDGSARALVFADVAPGIYAVLAYLDLNHNERLDIDASLKSIEPYRLSTAARAEQSTLPAENRVPAATAESAQATTAKVAADDRSRGVELEAAGVDVVLGETRLVEIDFRQLGRPARPDADAP